MLILDLLLGDPATEKPYQPGDLVDPNNKASLKRYYKHLQQQQESINQELNASLDDGGGDDDDKKKKKGKAVNGADNDVIPKDPDMDFYQQYKFVCVQTDEDSPHGFEQLTTCLSFVEYIEGWVDSIYVKDILSNRSEYETDKYIIYKVNSIHYDGNGTIYKADQKYLSFLQPAANKFNNPEGKYRTKNAKGEELEFGTRIIVDLETENIKFVGELEYANVYRTGTYKKGNIILLNNGTQIALDSGSQYIIDLAQRFIRTWDYLPTYYLWRLKEKGLEGQLMLIDEFKPKMEGINKYIYKIIKDVLRNEAEPNYRSPYILSWIYRKAFGRKTKQEAIQLLSSWKESPDMTEPDLPNDSLF